MWCEQVTGDVRYVKGLYNCYTAGRSFLPFKAQAALCKAHRVNNTQAAYAKNGYPLIN
jgi:hypothetical protein